MNNQELGIVNQVKIIFPTAGDSHIKIASF